MRREIVVREWSERGGREWSEWSERRGRECMRKEREGIG